MLSRRNRANAYERGAKQQGIGEIIAFRHLLTSSMVSRAIDSNGLMMARSTHANTPFGLPDTFSEADHSLASVIASPDFFAFFVAFCAGAAGMISLSTAKSGALIGVLISVTTIPAAANIGVSAAYADWPSFRGSVTQLGVNLAAILSAGTLTLAIQRAVYNRRRERHVREELARSAAAGVGAGAREAS